MTKILRIATLSLTAIVPAPLLAATITNLDEVEYTLVIAEGSSQSQVTIGAGQSIEICSQGCFLTLPNGDREVLTGPEQFEIREGRVKFL